MVNINLTDTSGLILTKAQPTHAVGASCSGLYEEGKVKHIKCGIGVRNLHARLSLSQYQTRSIR